MSHEVMHQGWKNLVHVCIVHQTRAKHRLEEHEILCTNIIFHGNQYIECLLFESKRNLSATSEHGLYIEQKKLIHFASISTLMKKQSMVVILLSRPPSYGCALIILQTCVMCFAIYLVTSWNNDFNYSENEPSKCYIILSGHNKILFP